MTRSIDRRDFVAGGLGIFAAPSLRFDSHSPNDKIVVGVMGLQSRGTQLARDIAKIDGVEVGYLCDVDARTFDKAAQAILPNQKRGPKRVEDFRRMLDDPAVNAIVIATPDHWHAPAAILACAADKDVYVEKPCSHNAREGELLVAAAKKHGRIVQMGNQRRSWPAVIEAIETARTKIGEPYFARCWYANRRGRTGDRKKIEIPKWLDWELWQGPAPRAEFAADIVHYKWHWYWDWGTGELGNNGVHSIDLARWALGVDYPSRVVSAGGRYHFADAQETPDTQTASWEFDGDGRQKQIIWESLSCNRQGPDGTGFGACIVGTEGSVTIGAREWARRDLAGKEIERKKIPGGNAEHLEDFFQAMRTRRAPNSAIANARASTLLCHLGNIAHRTGRALSVDPKTGRALGLDERESAELWTRSYARGWEPRV